MQNLLGGRYRRRVNSVDGSLNGEEGRVFSRLASVSGKVNHIYLGPNFVAFHLRLKNRIMNNIFLPASR